MRSIKNIADFLLVFGIKDFRFPFIVETPLVGCHEGYLPREQPIPVNPKGSLLGPSQACSDWCNLEKNAKVT